MKPPLWPVVVVGAVLAGTCLDTCSGFPCSSHQYWSSRQVRCAPCSKCPPKMVVQTPCQSHRNTQCVPIDRLGIDWSWMRKEEVLEAAYKTTVVRPPPPPPPPAPPATIAVDDAAPEETIVFDKKVLEKTKKKALSEKELKIWLSVSQDKLKHKKDDLMKNLKEERPPGDSEAEGLRLNRPVLERLDPLLVQRLLARGEHKPKAHTQKITGLEMKMFEKALDGEEAGGYNLNIVDLMKGGDRAQQQQQQEEDEGQQHRRRLAPTSSSSSTTSSGMVVPFTAAESIVWDWQAVALASAVLSCLLFFAAAALYVLVNARQWNSIKNRYDTDLDEMSSRLALMQSPVCGGERSAVGNAAVIETSAAAAAETNDTARYLRQLIASQNFNERKNNIYIDDKQLTSS